MSSRNANNVKPRSIKNGEKSSAVQKAIVPKKATVGVIQTTLRRFLKMVRSFPPSERRALGLGKNIPYNKVSFRKGTQYPVIRLYFSKVDIVTSMSTNYNTVFTLSAANLQNFSDLAGIFDEYRVIVGEIEFYPLQSTINGGYPSIAVIDYDESTALTTAGDGIPYDTKKFFTQSIPTSGELKPVRWKVEFEPLPDQDWIDTATTSTAFAYWKPFIWGPASSYAVGTLTGWIDVQFRNSH